MFECPDCKTKMKRMYSKEYLDENYPINSPMDKANMKVHIESKRLFECPDCGYKHTLSNKEYIVYIKDEVFKR